MARKHEYKERVSKLHYYEAAELDALNKIASETATDANSIIRGLLNNYLILINYEKRNEKKRNRKKRA